MPETPQAKPGASEQPKLEKRPDAVTNDGKAALADFSKIFEAEFFKPESIKAFQKSEAEGYKVMVASYLGINLDKVQFNKINGGHQFNNPVDYYTLKNANGRLFGSFMFDRSTGKNERSLFLLDTSGQHLKWTPLSRPKKWNSKLHLREPNSTTR